MPRPPAEVPRRSRTVYVTDELWRDLDRAYLQRRLTDATAASFAKADFLEEVLRAGLASLFAGD